MKVSGALRWLSLGLAFSVATACLVKSPTVATQSIQPTIQHAAFIGSNTCESCHETDRPGPLGDEPHGGGADCLQCHTTSDTNAGWLPVLAFNHTPTPTTCQNCHAQDREAPPHTPTGDCVSCHVYDPTGFKPGITPTTTTTNSTGT